ncbi:MAG: hypothetical protein H6526_06035 [Actinobacteria bacterium]|nr:hypothetical protein [Actinomycetota bacterium]MCB8997550.1 hypothetical protein [Actinomycetota bacterium]MCB9414825.1 hypothetical protein [Actinomycetota bacterium]MCB9423785.1 hypothetical protein [Actinomycetota bacterium]HRY10576.1 hypothetical protein [Candidatus Nanopelagicales bacterium]
MQTSSDDPRHSGSRWEPDPAEQTTDVLGPPAEAQSKVPPPTSPRRGLSTTAAVLIAVVIGGIGGAVVGFAVAADREPQPVSGVVTEQGQAPGQLGRGQGQGQVPGENEQFGVPGRGHHGYGEHEGDDR